MTATDPTTRSLAEARPTSFWLDDPARPEPCPSLRGTHTTDLAIVGGGFTGLWAAIEAKERDPGREVTVLEAELVGGAATGRNGGFLSASLTHGPDNGTARFPDEIDEIERQAMGNFRASPSSRASGSRTGGEV